MAMDFQIIFQPALTAITVSIYFVALALVNTAVTKFGTRQKFLEKRIVYIKKIFALFLFSILLLTFAFIWGIDFRGVMIFASSFFAVLGMALFASWSVLSNITSGIIIFFSFPYKIGDAVKILDGENSVTGKILDMTLFHIQVQDEEGHLIFYPNNIAIQKPISRLS